MNLFKKIYKDFKKNLKADKEGYNKNDKKSIVKFLDAYSNEIDWSWLSEHKELTEDIIIEFQDKVDWNRISSEQRLSEAFIEKFKDIKY